MAVATPEMPPRQSLDQTLGPLVVLSGLGLFPLVGGVVQPWAQEALERGQRALVQQFLEEVAATLKRHEQRVGNVELTGFLARREAAAALNTALALAAKTASREKHQILAQALINGASASSVDQALLPHFWTLVERHSALDVKILRFLSDPVNLAIRAGYEFVGKAIQGECMFAVLPELRYGYLVERDGRVELVQDHEEDEEEDFDAPEHDPSLPPDRYFLFWQSMRSLHDDGLMGSLGDQSFDDYMEEFEEMTLSLGEDLQRDKDGLYPGRPFETVSELGARYLAFLSEPPMQTDKDERH